MKGPTPEERRLYPHLVRRKVWPPEPVAPLDLTPSELEEHRRYWKHQDVFLIEDDVRVAEPFTGSDEPCADIEGEPIDTSGTLEEFVHIREMVMGIEVYERELLERAAKLPMSEPEREILAMAQKGSEQARRMVLEMMLHQRMDKLRKTDIDKARSELEEKLQPDLKQRLREYFFSYRQVGNG